MKYSSVALGLALATAFSTGAVADSGLAYEENKLNYRNCQDENVTARWYSGGFSVSRAGASPTDPAPAVAFKSWDGKCQTFFWDEAKAQFAVDDGAETQSSEILKYVAWDGGKWAAARTGGGFYVSRVSKDSTQPSPDDLSNAAKWLRRKDPENFGAIALANVLSKEAEGAERTE